MAVGCRIQLEDVSMVHLQGVKNNEVWGCFRFHRVDAHRWRGKRQLRCTCCPLLARRFTGNPTLHKKQPPVYSLEWAMGEWNRVLLGPGTSNGRFRGYRGMHGGKRNGRCRRSICHVKSQGVVRVLGFVNLHSFACEATGRHCGYLAGIVRSPTVTLAISSMSWIWSKRQVF